MKYLLIILLLIGSLLADEYKVMTNTYLSYDKAYGVIDPSYFKNNKGIVDRTILDTNVIFMNNKNKFVMNINYTGFNGMGYNNKYKMFIGNFDTLNVTNLYYTRSITDRLKASIGIFNFKADSFNITGLYNSNNSIGIYGLVDFELEGILLSYKYKDVMITAGRISKGTVTETTYVLNTNKNTAESKRLLSALNGSKGFVVMAKYSMTKEIDMEFNYFNYDETLLGVSVKKLNLLALDMRYDKMETDGYSLYGSISYSDIKGDSTGFRTLDNGGYGFSNAYYDKYKVSGYSLLLNASKSLDNIIMGRDLLIGLEGKYVSAGYDNLAIGIPLSINNSGAVGYTAKLFCVATINRNFLIKTMIGRYFNGTGKTTQIHGVPVVTDIDNNGIGTNAMSIFSLGLIYKF